MAYLSFFGHLFAGCGLLFIWDKVFSQWLKNHYNKNKTDKSRPTNGQQTADRFWPICRPTDSHGKTVEILKTLSTLTQEPTRTRSNACGVGWGELLFTNTEPFEIYNLLWPTITLSIGVWIGILSKIIIRAIASSRQTEELVENKSC